MNTDSSGSKARRWGTLILLTVAQSLGLQASQADDTPSLSLSGFYTLNASLAKGHDVFYPPDPNDLNVIKLEEGKTSFDYSLVGAQADLTLSDRLRFTTQVVSSVQTRHGNRPVVEWAYLTYDFGDDLYLRGGKLKTPLLQGTELRYVGFSRLWVRPLVPNSGAGGMDHYTGLELIKNARLDDYNLRLQAGLGVPQHERDNIDGKNIAHASVHFERDEYWINFALFQAHFDLFSSNDPVRLVDKNSRLTMASIETELWFDNIVVNAGLAKGLGETVPDETLRYLSLGYRHGAFTPYFLYQYREMLFPRLETAPPRPGPIPPSPPPIEPRPAQPRAGPYSTDTFALGVRYDLNDSHALKFQVERQFDKDNSYLGLPSRETSATIYSIVFEGLF